MSTSANNQLADWLDAMHEAALRACRFVEGMDRDAFLGDARTQQAVAMSLLVVGETAARALDKYCDALRAYPEIPWSSMRGMRNRIAHGYFELDMAVVWTTVQHSLPPLIEALPKVIKSVRKS